jgi:hypothetical protein
VKRSSPIDRFARLLLFALVTAIAATCDSSTVPPAGDMLAFGTWGGTNSGAIVSDSGTHVHIGCTYGDVIGIVPLDELGRFDVSGSYLIRAYPIAVGPSMPAQFTGRVIGLKLTLTVAVNDTVEHKTQIFGPVTVEYGKPPAMGPCPICRSPAMRLR